MVSLWVPFKFPKRVRSVRSKNTHLKKENNNCHNSAARDTEESQRAWHELQPLMKISKFPFKWPDYVTKFTLESKLCFSACRSPVSNLRARSPNELGSAMTLPPCCGMARTLSCSTCHPKHQTKPIQVPQWAKSRQLTAFVRFMRNIQAKG